MIYATKGAEKYELKLPKPILGRDLSNLVVETAIGSLQTNRTRYSRIESESFEPNERGIIVRKEERAEFDCIDLYSWSFRKMLEIAGNVALPSFFLMEAPLLIFSPWIIKYGGRHQVSTEIDADSEIEKVTFKRTSVWSDKDYKKKMDPRMLKFLGDLYRRVDGKR